MTKLEKYRQIQAAMACLTMVERFVITRMTGFDTEPDTRESILWQLKNGTTGGDLTLQKLLDAETTGLWKLALLHGVTRDDLAAASQDRQSGALRPA